MWNTSTIKPVGLSVLLEDSEPRFFLRYFTFLSLFSPCKKDEMEKKDLRICSKILVLLLPVFLALLFPLPFAGLDFSLRLLISASLDYCHQ